MRNARLNCCSLPEIERMIKLFEAMPAFRKEVIDALHNYKVDRMLQHPSTRYGVGFADQSLAKR